MNRFKRLIELGQSGFSHVEIMLVVVVIAGLTGIGSYVYSHDKTSHAGSSMTSLNTFILAGQTFSGQACVDGSSGGNDVIETVVSGPAAAFTASDSGYGVSGFYRVGSGDIITEDNWSSGSTYVLTFNATLPSTSTLAVGAEGSTVKTINDKSSTIEFSANELNPCSDVVGSTITTASTATIAATETTVVNSPTCPSGWPTLVGTRCSRTIVSSTANCTNNGGSVGALSSKGEYECTLYTADVPANPATTISYLCPKGYAVSGTECTPINTAPITNTSSYAAIPTSGTCPSGFKVAATTPNTYCTFSINSVDPVVAPVASNTVPTTTVVTTTTTPALSTISSNGSCPSNETKTIRYIGDGSSPTTFCTSSSSTVTGSSTAAITTGSATAHVSESILTRIGHFFKHLF